MKMPSGKSFALFFAGFGVGIASLIGASMVFYLFVIGPMANKALTQANHRAPPFPAATLTPAVLQGRWTSLSGKPLDVASLKGKVTVLNVWATWCPPCRAELPSLQQLAAHYAAAPDVAVVCVSTEPLAKTRSEMKDPAMQDLLF